MTADVTGGTQDMSYWSLVYYSVLCCDAARRRRRASPCRGSARWRWARRRVGATRRVRARTSRWRSITRSSAIRSQWSWLLRTPTPTPARVQYTIHYIIPYITLYNIKYTRPTARVKYIAYRPQIYNTMRHSDSNELNLIYCALTTFWEYNISYIHKYSTVYSQCTTWINIRDRTTRIRNIFGLVLAAFGPDVGSSSTLVSECMQFASGYVPVLIYAVDSSHLEEYVCSYS